MSRLTDALKNLGKKFNTSATAPSGEKVEDVIASMTSNFNIATTDTKPTALALTTTSGVVTGGTLTLSDSTTITVTVSGT